VTGAAPEPLADHVKAAASKLTAAFIARSKPRSESSGQRTHLGVTAMTHPTAHPKPHASLWAVGLLLISTAFALISILLLSTGYNPL
jgi:hypothetical protein